MITQRRQVRDGLAVGVPYENKHRYVSRCFSTSCSFDIHIARDIINNSMLIYVFFIVGSVAVHTIDRFVCPGHHRSAYPPTRLPARWSHGSSNCFDRTQQRAALEIITVDQDTFILRQDKCINYEGAFLYVLFGQRQVLLIDSGAIVSSTTLPVQQQVEHIIVDWCTRRRKRRRDVELIVAHTHHHADHIAGDEQFRRQPSTTVVDTNVDAIRRFFQLNDWPNSIGVYALDEQRHLAIIPVPGHEQASIAFYDCATGLLLTGDTFYPGRLYVSNFSDYVQSIARLTDFVRVNRLHLSAIVGAHIEMSTIDRVEYPLGATYQPNERSLNMSFEQLEQLNRELQSQWTNGFSRRHRAVFDTFIVDPHRSELPRLQANGRQSIYRFTLLVLNRFGDVCIVYRPDFRTNIDFQLIFRARTNHSLAMSSNIEQHWTLESNRLSLNDLINGDLLLFRVRVFHGRTGTYVDDMTLRVSQPLSTIDSIDLLDVEPYQPLRYVSYRATTSNQSDVMLNLVHQMRRQPDFHGIVRVRIHPSDCRTDIDRSQLKHLLEHDGNQWAFHGRDNRVTHRLVTTLQRVRSQLLGDIYATVCTMQIVNEIECK
jgi:hydroxyacylglutathione hydrolase